MLEQPLRPGQLGRARKAYVVVRGSSALSIMRAEAGPDAVEPGQTWVLGQEGDPRVRVQEASGVEQRCNHERFHRDAPS